MLPAWPDILCPLLLLGAECLLLPIYADLHPWPPKLLMALAQGMIGYAITQTLLQAASCQRPLRISDWRQSTFGGYTLRISATEHGSGDNPGFDIAGAQSPVRALIDQRGAITLFADRPLRALISIRRQSWLRFQDGGGNTTTQSSSDKVK